MVVKNPLSKIREKLEISELEKRLEEFYGKYGIIPLESMKGYLKILKEENEISNEDYRRILETLLRDDIREFFDYIWEKTYNKTGIISSLIPYAIINARRHIGDENMFGEFIKVLKMYSEVFDKEGEPVIEYISASMFYPAYYGTPLKVGDSRIPLVIKCVQNELSKEETKERVREDKHTINRIIINCAKKAGFRPLVYKT